MLFTVVDKHSGEIEEVEAVSQRQALYKLALDKSKNIEDRKRRKYTAGILFAAMLKSHEALLLNDPQQTELFS